MVGLSGATLGFLFIIIYDHQEYNTKELLMSEEIKSATDLLIKINQSTIDNRFLRDEKADLLEAIELAFDFMVELDKYHPKVKGFIISNFVSGYFSSWSEPVARAGWDEADI